LKSGKWGLPPPPIHHPDLTQRSPGIYKFLLSYGAQRVVDVRTPLSGLQHIVFRDRPHRLVDQEHIDIWISDMATPMIMFLSMLPGVADNLRSFTWVTRLSADDIKTVVDDMAEKLNCKTPTQVVKEGETQVCWEAAGDAPLDIGGSVGSLLRPLNRILQPWAADQHIALNFEIEENLLCVHQRHRAKANHYLMRMAGDN
jgi:hypothetical protein